MSGTITIKNLTLGDGCPKICVPLTDGSHESLLWGAVLAKAAAADLVEWRADCYGAANLQSVLKTAEALHGAMGETPLLFTYRSKAEGGSGEISKGDYLLLCREVAKKGFADAIDIELGYGDEFVARLAAEIRGYGVATVVSSHDFAATPPREAMLNRLHRMRKLGADIPKLAVMPGSFTDVLSLLAATEEFARSADCPVITMSMGALGRLSRVAGAFTGSAVTFGTVEDASAPGQLPVSQLREILKALQNGNPAL